MKKVRTVRFWRRLWKVYAAGLLGAVLLADAGKLPVRILGVVPRYDLICHFFLYGFAVALLHKGDYSLYRGKRAILLPLMVSAGAFLEELSQIFFSSRSFSAVDLAFGLAGIALFYGKSRTALGKQGKEKTFKPPLRRTPN